MRVWVLIAATVLCGCAAENLRWASNAGERESVGPAGARYLVRWHKVDGGYDFRSHYNEAFGRPEALVDKMRSDAAVMEVARKLCAAEPRVLASTTEAFIYTTRIACD